VGSAALLLRPESTQMGRNGRRCRGTFEALLQGGNVPAEAQRVNGTPRGPARGKEPAETIREA
jgi:hypothetical protein